MPAFSAKAKRKALLAKADTQGTKGSMLDAFVTPPPAKSDAEQDSAPKAATADQPAQTPAKTELTKVCASLLSMTGVFMVMCTLRSFTQSCIYKSCLSYLQEESEGFEDWEAAAEGMATPSAAVAAERSAAARAAVVDASDCKCVLFLSLAHPPHVPRHVHITLALTSSVREASQISTSTMHESSQ